MTTKQCKVCESVKPIDLFPKRTLTCKKCESVKSMARQRAKAESDPAFFYRRKKAWCEKNPDKAKLQKQEESLRRRIRQSESKGIQYQPFAEKMSAKQIERAEAQFQRLWSVEGIDAHVATWDLQIRKAERESLGLTEYAYRYRHDIQFNAKERLRNMLKKHAKKYSWIHFHFGSAARSRQWTNGSAVWEIVGYSAKEFTDHIQALFTEGMTWEKFLAGEIHIDHVIPKCLFDMDDLQCVRECYALSNLQPLWSEDNLRKCKKVCAGAGPQIFAGPPGASPCG